MTNSSTCVAGGQYCKLYGLFVPRRTSRILQIKLHAFPSLDALAHSGGAFSACSVDADASGLEPYLESGERFDLVVVHLQTEHDSTAVVHAPPAALLAKASVLTADGGSLLLVVPNTALNLIARLRGRPRPPRLSGFADDALASVRSYRRWLRRHGLQVLNTHCVFPSARSPRYLVSTDTSMLRRFFLQHGQRTAGRHSLVKSFLRSLIHWSTLDRFSSECFVVSCRR